MKMMSMKANIFKKQTDWLSILLTTVILFCFSATSVFAGPRDAENYDIQQGGFADIKDGAYVEGSSKKGGMQPDYTIDLNEEPLKSVIESARRIGQSEISYWDKVGMIVDLIRSDVFKYKKYRNPYYLRLMKEYRDANTDIPLNDYVACGAGVCREHALVLHFALKAAGIENLHAYAKVYRASSWHDYEIVEDHAFVVVERFGAKWVVDAYYWGFNGFMLRDLMSEQGITEKSLYVPIADPAPGTRRIMEINKFPLIYNPKINYLRCSKILL